MNDITLYITIIAILEIIFIAAIVVLSCMLVSAKDCKTFKWYDVRYHTPIYYEDGTNRIRVMVADTFGEIYEDVFNTCSLSYEGTEDQAQILFFAYVDELRLLLPKTKQKS